MTTDEEAVDTYALSRDVPFSICAVCKGPMRLEDQPAHRHEDCHYPDNSPYDDRD